MGTLQTLAETDERRLLLFSTRLRFMPQVQPIRETAINKIIETEFVAGGQSTLSQRNRKAVPRPQWPLCSVSQ